MKVFISWSGKRSQYVALALKELLGDVVQAVHTWVSKADIEAGSRWNVDIARELNDTKFGIICLSSDNVNAPWILFEAGALAKSMVDSHVCPYLIDMKPSDIPEGPLAQFQAKQTSKEETFELITTINNLLEPGGLEKVRLERIFNRCWLDFEKKLSNIPSSEIDDEVQRPERELLEEILDTVRGLSRRNDGIPSKKLVARPGGIISSQLGDEFRDIYRSPMSTTTTTRTVDPPFKSNHSPSNISSDKISAADVEDKD